MTLLNISASNHVGEQTFYLENIDEINMTTIIFQEHNIFLSSKMEFNEGLDCVRIKNSKSITLFDMIFQRSFSSKTTAALSILDENSNYTSEFQLKVIKDLNILLNLNFKLFQRKGLFKGVFLIISKLFIIVIKIKDCIFIQNRAIQGSDLISGAAIYIKSPHNVEIMNCAFLVFFK